MTTDIKVIKKHLDRFFIFKGQHQEERTFMNGMILSSGIFEFRVVVKEGVSVEEIPHLTEIAGLEALITVSGRAPLCLTCNLVGHIARDCPTPFCKTCEVTKDRVHVCDGLKAKRTYANAARNYDLDGFCGDWSEDQNIADGNIKDQEDQLKVSVRAKTNESKGQEIKSALNIFSKDKEGRRNISSAFNVEKKGHASQVCLENFNKAEMFSVSGSEESEQDNSDVEASPKDVLGLFQNYITELNSFKILPLNEGGGAEGGKETLIQGSREQIGCDDNMQIDNLSLKRKINEAASVKNQESEKEDDKNEVWIKAYGRKKTIRKVKVNKQFQDPEEKREFIFQD